MDSSDYLFLHLMDGNDGQIHDAITCFYVKFEVVCDTVNDDEDAINGCFAEPISSDSNKTRETYFSWNEKMRLKLGPVTDKSSLKITLLKKEIDDTTSSDTHDMQGMPVRQLVYAEASILIRKLQSVQSLRSDLQSLPRYLDAGQQEFKRLDRLLYLKIIPRKNKPELRNERKRTANADTAKDTRPLSPDSKIRAAEDAYSAALDELSATWIGPNPAENPSSRAQPRDQVVAELGSSHSEVDHGVSPLFFRLRLGYMLVTATGISTGTGPQPAMESRSRSSTMERSSRNEGEGLGSDGAGCPPLSYHANIAELTRLFFSGGSSASRRRLEPPINASRDFSSTQIGRNVEVDKILMEHAYISGSSSRSVGRRGITKGTLRKSAINPIYNRAAQNIFDELHNMCCQSSFPATSTLEKNKYDRTDTAHLESSRVTEFGQTTGPRSVEKFLACEFEMPSRTFVAFLRVRVSAHWAVYVQKLVDELSAAAGLLGGMLVADTGGGLLSESNTHPQDNNSSIDLGSVRDSSSVEEALSGATGASPETTRILDLLRAGAKVRVVDRNTLGVSLSRHFSGGVGVASVGRGVPTVAIVRFSESSAIRFLKAAIDSQGGLDAGGVAAVVSPALQALLDQSDTRSLTDQMSEIESLFHASQLEEEALCDILQENKTIVTHVKSEHFTIEKTRDRDFYKCMSDLTEIRTLTLSDGSPKGRISKEMYRRRMVMKRDALLCALSQIEAMKATCATASDAVFRSLIKAQEEGGHALVSARARNLLLPVYTGSSKSSRSAKKASREIDVGVNQGCYSDMLLLGKELRVVEKMVKQTIGTLSGFSTVNQTEDGDVADSMKEDLKNLPHSPQTHSVRDKENQQWQNSNASSAPARTTSSVAVATTTTTTTAAAATATNTAATAVAAGKGTILVSSHAIPVTEEEHTDSQSNNSPTTSSGCRSIETSTARFMQGHPLRSRRCREYSLF